MTQTGISPGGIDTSEPVDPEELRACYVDARHHDEMAAARRRRGEELVVRAKLQGMPVREIMGYTELGHQRIYQLLNAAGASSRPRPKKDDRDSRLTGTMADLYLDSD